MTKLISVIFFEVFCTNVRTRVHASLQPPTNLNPRRGNAMREV